VEEANDGVEGADEICYEEPDQSEGLEGVDYLIVYGIVEVPEENNVSASQVEVVEHHRIL
jgi:hypothetical protein